MVPGGTTTRMGIVTDSRPHFDVHHGGRDLLDAVRPRELGFGAGALAFLVV